MTRIPLSRADLEAHLTDQVAFIEASAASYDGGFLGEAKRLAVSLRILLHDRGQSHALLKQLGRLDGMSFFDSTLPNQPGNLLTYSGLVVTAHTVEGAEYLPLLDDHQIGPGEWIQFPSWWESAIFVDNARRKISRQDLVLSLANQDGGAHVDPALTESYHALTKENAMGWVLRKGAVERPMGSPHLASVRQIAHELLKSLNRGYARSNPARNDVRMYSAGAQVHAGGAPRVTPSFLGPRIVRPASAVPKQGRNERCLCGSGKKFKYCHGA